MHEQDNWVTKLNYSERAKGALIGLFFGSAAIMARHLDQLSSTPKFARGHMYDFTGPLCYAAFLKVTLNIKSTLGTAAYGFVACSSIEALQGVGLKGVGLGDTYDGYDFLAYGLGTLSWIAFDGLAKLIYHSGITKPIYRALHIRDRRLYANLTDPSESQVL